MTEEFKEYKLLQHKFEQGEITLKEYIQDVINTARSWGMHDGFHWGYDVCQDITEQKLKEAMIFSVEIPDHVKSKRPEVVIFKDIKNVTIKLKDQQGNEIL